jgi:hypothetical protein
MKKDRIISLFLTSAIAIVFALTVRGLIAGAFPFWFDPARDVALGLANLKKLSLIGHPSGGLPGLFYGPYYIWSISFAELFSKDPRWVWFMFATVPYFTLFPFILTRFRKFADYPTLLSFFLVFLLSFSNHAQVWNPNPTPLMYLFAVYFAFQTLFRKKTNIPFAFLTGLSAGLIANYHMSYGIGIVASFAAAFLCDILYRLLRKQAGREALLRKMLGFFAYGTGVFITYIPLLLFEVRHGFNQVKIILENFALGMKGASLNLGHGFSKAGIVDYFFVQGGKLLHLPSNILMLLAAGIAIAYGVYVWKKRKSPLADDEKRLLGIVAINAATVLAVFLMTKNPVYDYFFIGVEMFFLLAALVVMKRIPYVKYLVTGLALYLFFMRIGNEAVSWNKPNTSSNYGSKKKTVELIYRDAKKPPFTVLVYDPAIYTYDYDYLFTLMGETYGFEPNRTKGDEQTVYVVLPETNNKGAAQSFADYHTPESQYRTAKRWVTEDRTVVLRREKRN